jgi:hypothetical protein
LIHPPVGGEYSLLELRRVEIARLRARVDSLENDSATIERLARERYGLIRPGERLYWFVEEDTAGGEYKIVFLHVTERDNVWCGGDDDLGWRNFVYTDNGQFRTLFVEGSPTVNVTLAWTPTLK